MTQPNQSNMIAIIHRILCQKNFSNIEYTFLPEDALDLPLSALASSSVTHSLHPVHRKKEYLKQTAFPSNYCSCFYQAIKVAREIIYTHTCKIRETSCFIALT